MVVPKYLVSRVCGAIAAGSSTRGGRAGAGAKKTGGVVDLGIWGRV
jgi:hypothetical protein